MWTFSPSSQPYLEKCIAAAALQETDNKWSQRFGRKTVKLNNNKENNVCEIVVTAPSPEEQGQKEERKESSYDEFFEGLENELQFDTIVKECIENKNLFIKMAQELPENTVEKIFSHVFINDHVQNDFIFGLFTIFLPAYLKLHNSWQSIDLLTKCREKYSEIFIQVLEILIKDSAVSCQVLNSYASTLREENLNGFIENLTLIDFTEESFKNNLLMIFTVYKDCTKTDTIQNYIKNNLIKHKDICFNDKNYGKLFLTYLQTEKLLHRKIDLEMLEECLDVHRSPFKRPCSVLLKELSINN